MGNAAVLFSFVVLLQIVSIVVAGKFWSVLLLKDCLLLVVT